MVSVCANHLSLVSQILKQLFKIFVHSFIHLYFWRKAGATAHGGPRTPARAGSRPTTGSRVLTPLPMSALSGPLGKLLSWLSTFYILRKSTSLMGSFFFTKPGLTIQRSEHVQVCFHSSTAVFFITETAIFSHFEAYLISQGCFRCPIINVLLHL